MTKKEQQKESVNTSKNTNNGIIKNTIINLSSSPGRTAILFLITIIHLCALVAIISSVIPILAEKAILAKESLNGISLDNPEKINELQTISNDINAMNQGVEKMILWAFAFIIIANTIGQTLFYALYAQLKKTRLIIATGGMILLINILAVTMIDIGMRTTSHFAANPLADAVNGNFPFLIIPIIILAIAVQAILIMIPVIINHLKDVDNNQLAYKNKSNKISLVLIALKNSTKTIKENWKSILLTQVTLFLINSILLGVTSIIIIAFSGLTSLIIGLLALTMIVLPMITLARMIVYEKIKAII